MAIDIGRGGRDPPRDKIVTQLADEESIYSGVSRSVVGDQCTLFIRNHSVVANGGSDTVLKIWYSPTGSDDYFYDPDGTITVPKGGSTIVKIDYDVESIKIQANNTEDVTAYLVQR